jgi:hypothetical protein
MKETYSEEAENCIWKKIFGRGREEVKGGRKIIA